MVNYLNICVCIFSNEEPIFDSKSEVLWSREKNGVVSQNDFFRGLQDGFSDLTEGSTSSCSWHNDVSIYKIL